MDKVHFLLGVHNHQPIGNFDFVFEKAYLQSYLPFLEAMERHPRLHWNMHSTGILWEWLDHHHPKYVDRVARLVHKGQLEILTGGYYEPILPALPDRDKIGQIQKLTRYIQKRFKVTPKGMWLAERVWEPHLASVLRGCGIQYTLVDDAHFFTTGMTEDQMTGPYISEEQGEALTLLPIRQDLRYAIPFKDPGDTLTLLRKYVSPSAHRALVMFDDGEKFGLWPETYEHVYTDGWLEKFLTVLESNSDWILCSRISDYLAGTIPHGRVYLPTASYYEMSEWTLPASSQETLMDLLKTVESQAGIEIGKRFLRGGFWRNFLTKYEESNNIHKKMLWVSEKVHRAVQKVNRPASSVSAKAQKMLDALWGGQCNCAYWHGVFGGLYLPHLRQALYRYLLQAEVLADKVLGSEGTTVTEKDFDLDGTQELLLETPTQNIYISPELGGSIFEWDLRARGVNLANVLTRRAEGYHRQLLNFVRQPMRGGANQGGAKTIHDMVRVKEPGLEKRLHVDWYRRTSLLEHFFHPDTTLESFYRCQFGEQGDFVKMGFVPTVLREANQPLKIRLERTGTVWSASGQRNTLRLRKLLTFEQPLGWSVRYELTNMDGPFCALWWGSEMNFAFSTQDQPDPLTHGEQTLWIRRDHGLGLAVSLRLAESAELWEFPLETVSLSEEGFERTYQGTVLVVNHRLKLEPKETAVRRWSVEAKPE